MSDFQRISGKALMVLTVLAMAVAVILGVTRDVLISLAPNLDSALILLMIYGSYPLYMLLLLWPKLKSDTEYWILLLGWLPFFLIVIFSWHMVYAAASGAVPALVMVWYGMLQSGVVAVLFIILASVRLRHAG